MACSSSTLVLLYGPPGRPARRAMGPLVYGSLLALWRVEGVLMAPLGTDRVFTDSLRLAP